MLERFLEILGRGFGQVFNSRERSVRLSKGLGEGFGSGRLQKSFLPNGKRLKYKKQPPKKQTDR